MTKLAEIEGIGPAYASKLEGCGVVSQQDLLAKGGKPAGRKQLAADSGLPEKRILGWVNRADLARVKGVGSEYADLLECAGVDTVPELAQRKPANLQAKMVEVNEAKKLVRKVPTEAQVEKWVAQAKELPRAVSH